ncbi:MAG: ATP phosphoribosyltransferase [Chloroflexota bacterium]
MLSKEVDQEARQEIRLALPSKGRLAEEALEMLERAGLQVYKPNPRQYRAVIPALPGLAVLFQRPGDIVTSVRDGSVDFGVTGWDVFCERKGENGDMLALLKELGVGHCKLNVIVPESWEATRSMADLAAWQAKRGQALRVATKFPNLTSAFFVERGITNLRMISAEGTLEIAPEIGYADVIVDLVSTGTTLRDNRLKRIEDGLILHSQACLIANRAALKRRTEVLAMARQLLEFIVAYLRAAENVSVFANIRGDSPAGIAERMFAQQVIGGLQGPTISPVVTREGGNWYAVHLVVRKDRLAQAIAELRQIGGSGVVVAPVLYIFEEEPQAYRELLAALEDGIQGQKAMNAEQSLALADEPPAETGF